MESSQVHFIPFQTPKTPESEKKSQEISTINKVNKVISPSKTNLPNPAIVIMGCSRYNNIRNSINALLKLKDVSQYQLYVSLGCPRQLNQNVADASASSPSSCSRHCLRK